MRVFESLNCIVCKQPFARVANQDRSPRHLSCCGLAMCNECFEKEKGMRNHQLGRRNHQLEMRNHQLEMRNHQCKHAASFDHPQIACFLIDVLSQESALVFTPMGYLLVKPFKIPECPICLDEFSNEIEAKKSFALECGHIICTECCLKIRQGYYSNDYQNTCPTCRTTNLKTMYTVVNKQKDRFHDFLNELPEMTRQMEAMMKACCEKYQR